MAENEREAVRKALYEGLSWFGTLPEPEGDVPERYHRWGDLGELADRILTALRSTTAEPVKTSEGELLPCPRCGGDVILDDVSDFLGDAYWKAFCQNEECPQDKRWPTQAEAIYAANLRTHPTTDSAAKDAEIARLRDALEEIAANDYPYKTAPEAARAALANRGEAGALAKERGE